MTDDLFDAGPPQHDPGGKVRLKMLPGVRGSAIFSECGRYRFSLRRDWGGDDVPFVMWIAANPSTAEANIDDPTIRREIAFTKALGFSSMLKVNVMDFRATDPKRLLAPDVIPCSNGNVRFIETLSRAHRCARVMAAWGALSKSLRQYSEHVIEALVSVDLYCMGLTADGSPRHPLYLRNDAQPMLWRAAYREEKP